MPASFCDNAPYTDCIKAVYHSLPRQQFKDYKLDSALISKMQILVKAPKLEVAAPVRLALDYFKERLRPGVVFSFPDHALPDGVRAQGFGGQGDAVLGDAIVPVGEGGAAAFNPESIVQDALDIVGEVGHAVCRHRIGIAFQDHRFFKVLRTNLERRVVQHDSGRRLFCIAVTEMKLSSREGGEAVFQSMSQAGVITLDLLRWMERTDLPFVLKNLVSWASTGTSVLSLSLPALGDAAAHLLPNRLRDAHPPQPALMHARLSPLIPTHELLGPSC
jgi:hypothetical protein